jgi:hypothetical protein
MKVPIQIAFIILLVLSVQVATAAPTRSSSTSKGKSDKPATETPIEGGWPKLSKEENAAAITELKDFAQETQTTLNRPLSMYETKYFLFYSDLAPQEALNWAGLLDRMYARLAEMFAVPQGGNIWRGKALVFVFSKSEDYSNYEQKMLHTSAAGTAGLCHSFSNGDVKIAFYRQPDQLEFAHVLVHESVHGFIHRYRTPVPVPSWANEGLAETIATDLVPQRGRRDRSKQRAREGLEEHGKRMGDFFSEDHIEGWQYPVAEMLCTFMIQAGKKNYVDFIIGIKSGLTWRESLDKKYKAGIERLVPVYGQWLGVRGLQP